MLKNNYLLFYCNVFCFVLFKEMRNKTNQLNRKNHTAGIEQPKTLGLLIHCTSYIYQIRDKQYY